MNEVFGFAVYFVAGILLGFLYFGALWLTLRRLTHSRYLLASLLISMTLRVAFLLFCLFIILISSHSLQLLIVLAGFIAARVLMVHRLLKDRDSGKAPGSKTTKQNSPA